MFLYNVVSKGKIIIKYTIIIMSELRQLGALCYLIQLMLFGEVALIVVVGDHAYPRHGNEAEQ